MKDSISFKQIYKKYFIGDSTARGIVKEAMDVRAYWRPMNDI